jgi:hypothetical protein
MNGVGVAAKLRHREGVAPTPHHIIAHMQIPPGPLRPQYFVTRTCTLHREIPVKAARTQGRDGPRTFPDRMRRS